MGMAVPMVVTVAVIVIMIVGVVRMVASMHLLRVSVRMPFVRICMFAMRMLCTMSSMLVGGMFTALMPASMRTSSVRMSCSKGGCIFHIRSFIVKFCYIENPEAASESNILVAIPFTPKGNKERKAVMKIGELAASSDTSVETIRYYERENLLPAPARTASNYRQYTQAHLERLAFIRHCRALDISLTDIRQLIELMANPLSDGAHVDALVQAQLARVQNRLQSLQALENSCAPCKAVAPPTAMGSMSAASAPCCTNCWWPPAAKAVSATGKLPAHHPQPIRQIRQAPSTPSTTLALPLEGTQKQWARSLVERAHWGEIGVEGMPARLKEPH